MEKKAIPKELREYFRELGRKGGAERAKKGKRDGAGRFVK